MGKKYLATFGNYFLRFFDNEDEVRRYRKERTAFAVLKLKYNEIKRERERERNT